MNGFLDAPNGNKSSMRVGFWVSIAIAGFLSCYMIITKYVTVESVALVTSWLLSAFGGKGLQSFAEKKDKAV